MPGSPETFPSDAVAAATHPDPYPFYARRVALAPIAPLDFDEALGLWVAASAEAVTAVLTCDLCRVRPPAEPVPRALLGSPAGEVFGRLVRMTDGAGRCPMKQAIAETLASVAGEAAAAESRRRARALAAELAPAADPAAVSRFAFDLPAQVVASLLGVPPERLAEVARWTGDFVPCFSPLASPEQIEAGKEAAGRLLGLFRRLASAAADRAAGGGLSAPAAASGGLIATAASGGLLAALAREARRLGRDDSAAVVANAIGFLFQSYEATAGLIGNALLALAARPELRAPASDGILPDVVREVLRHDPPIQSTRRFLAGPATICGRELPAGAAVLVLLAAANRDPAANPDPDRFDVHRADRRSFTFGAGPHACPGEALAVAIAAAGVEVLLRSGVEPERLAERYAYRPSANARIPIFGAGSGKEHPCTP